MSHNLLTMFMQTQPSCGKSSGHCQLQPCGWKNSRLFFNKPRKIISYLRMGIVWPLSILWQKFQRLHLRRLQKMSQDLIPKSCHIKNVNQQYFPNAFFFQGRKWKIILLSPLLIVLKKRGTQGKLLVPNTA